VRRRHPRHTAEHHPPRTELPGPSSTARTRASLARRAASRNSAS
jgi:hypothetical protein